MRTSHGATRVLIQLSLRQRSPRKHALKTLEQLHRHGARRCIAFCCSQRHANFMAEYFNARGIRSVAVHAGAESAPRTSSLESLENGELDVIFSVDIFNEGVDVPSID